MGEGKKGKNREERVGGGLSEKGVSQEARVKVIWTGAEGRSIC